MTKNNLLVSVISRKGEKKKTKHELNIIIKYVLLFQPQFNGALNKTELPVEDRDVDGRHFSKLTDVETDFKSSDSLFLHQNEND